MDVKNLSVLITGGAGFIGSHVAEYLLNNGAKFVRIMDNLSTGSKNNIEHLHKFDNFEFLWGDVRNLETCRRACKQIDVICHQAGLGSVPRSIANPLDSHDVNVNGFVNILTAARDNNIRRIVYASSSSVYGSNNKTIKIEDETGTAMSPYAVTKYVTELYGKIFTYTYGLECIGLRYFNVFGPRQNPKGAYAAVIPKFINRIIKGKQPMINGDGTYSRDFTYIENVVQANILALTTTNKDSYGQAFNVGTNTTTSINQLVSLIAEISGKNCEPLYAPVRKGDVPYSNASINKISSILGYQPKVFFRDGLKTTIESFILKNKS